MRRFAPLAFTLLPPLASAQSHRVDRVDPPLGGQEFPGGRGPNQMVIYTPRRSSAGVSSRASATTTRRSRRMASSSPVTARRATGST
ncbi:MAG: hypothetical protein HUU25_13990 [Candidatus Sumerlaeia bacterium]|nr:hypothetical protein [Candidatus Sumerlaeia bacterium]